MRIYQGLDVQSDFGGRFPWKSRLIEVDHGVRQAVVDEGPRDAKLTFLLLHGNPTWSFLYREFIRRLSPKYRVIAPDHVGFGRSDKPRDPRWYTLDRHIGNLGKVLVELKAERVVPVIQELHESSELMRLAELERARRLLARGESPDAVLEALSKGLTAKFLHGPQQALHHAQGDERARLATLLPQLFRTRR